MADQITVRILHNENERNSFFHGYTDGDPLKEVYCGLHRYLTREPEASLEHIFEANQWVSESHRPWYDNARSLSVGDVIVLGDRAYACEKIGFRQVEVALV